MTSLYFAVLWSLSRVWLFVTPWTVPRQAPLSMGFPRKEQWGGFHFLLQGIFPTQESIPHLLHWQMDSLPLSHLGSPFLYIRFWQSTFCVDQKAGETSLRFISHSHSGTIGQDPHRVTDLLSNISCCTNYHVISSHVLSVPLNWLRLSPYIA